MNVNVTCVSVRVALVNDILEQALTHDAPPVFLRDDLADIYYSFPVDTFVSEREADPDKRDQRIADL